MANYEVPANPVYNAVVRKLENEDTISADDTFNPLIARLVENTAAVMKETEGKADANLSNVSKDTLLKTTVGEAKSVPWSGIKNKPTTLAGFGITDALTSEAPVFTGSPTAPTPNGDDNSSKLATTKYVKTQGYLTEDSPMDFGTF